MTEVVWRARALSDIRQIVEHISIDNPAAGRRVGRELVVAGDSLGMFPLRGRRGLRNGTRELLVTAPYLIVYRVAEMDRVTIVRVWHAAQDRFGPA